MVLFRPGTRAPHSYSLDEAAEFLEFDREAVAYWLRMGHLAGDRDKRTGEWRVQPQALIDFLRESQEPMPTLVARPERLTAPAERERSAIGA